MTKSKKKTVNTVDNVEVYDHINSEVKSPDELTLTEHVFVWTMSSLVLIFLVYVCLSITE